MLALKLALRNIPAHGQRNLVIAVVTGLVSTVLFLFLSFSDGEMENLKNGMASFYDPPYDVVAYNPDYLFASDRHQNGLEKTITGVSSVRRGLENLPGVKEAVPRFWGHTMNLYSQGRKYLNFSLVSLPDRDQFLHSRYKIIDGRDLTTGDKDVLLLHKTAMDSLPLRVGDRVSIVGNDYFGQIASHEVTLIGFYEPTYDYPELYQAALVDGPAAADLAGYGPDEANRILIRLTPGTDVGRAVGEMKSWSLKTGHPLDYRRADAEGQRGYFLIYEMVRVIFVVMVLLTLLITGFGIMNVVSVNLHDRRKEIGTYFCLGSEKPFLLGLYTWEILFVNLGGAVIGLALGLGIREGINAVGITSPDPGFQIVVGSSRFVLGLSLSSVFWVLGGVALVTILTALTTLGKALNVAPVEAVRETE